MKINWIISREISTARIMATSNLLVPRVSCTRTRKSETNDGTTDRSRTIEWDVKRQCPENREPREFRSSRSCCVSWTEPISDRRAASSASVIERRRCSSRSFGYRDESSDWHRTKLPSTSAIERAERPRRALYFIIAESGDTEREKNESK